jgi:hypothetical protein
MAKVGEGGFSKKIRSSRVISRRVSCSTSVNGQKWVLNEKSSRKAKTTKEISNMKNRNTEFVAVLVVLAFALAPVIQARPDADSGLFSLAPNEALRPTPMPRARPTPAPRPDGDPVALAANEGVSTNSEASSVGPEGSQDVQLPAVTIYSTGDVTRGKTGSFVLRMNPQLLLGGTYVNFSVSGTAVPGVDYVALVSPAYIGSSGYAVLLIKALPDPRGPADRQSYSVEVKLDSGLGYALGQPSSATMWIKP